MGGRLDSPGTAATTELYTVKLYADAGSRVAVGGPALGGLFADCQVGFLENYSQHPVARFRTRVLQSDTAAGVEFQEENRCIQN